ncbi:MAG: hypothetical protein H6981_12970 [Gammaproteobacteria bacterium]|nr:hypothetical protein [Gammaproteobacteria bacterium]MCP5137700.1 hypothetical protein [Gammaproteobacteria bacterium]
MNRMIPRLFAIVFVFGTASAAHAGMWLIDDTATLYSIDQQTSPVVTVGNTGIGSATALTVDNNGSLFTTDGTSLYTLNRTTAAATLVDTYLGIGTLQGLAFDGTNSLWGVSGNDLYLLANNGSGLFSWQATLGGSYDDLAIAQTDITYSGGTILAGTLLGLDATGGGSFIYAIDTGTFVETLIETIPLAVGDEAMTTDAGGGTLFTHNFNRESGGQGGVYEVDLTGANNDTLVKITPGRITGMFLEDTGASVPVPAPALLIGGAFLGMMAKRRRAH